VLRKFVVLVSLLALVAVPVGIHVAGASATPGLSYSGATSAATGSPAQLSATLNDAAGAPVAGAELTFTLANQPGIALTTDANGLAAGAVQILKAAGAYDLTIAGSGQSLTVPFTVTAPATTVTPVKAGTNGGEPSIAIGPEGNIYVSSPAAPILTKSTNGGATWKTITSAAPFSNSSDTSLATDTAGSVYITNLTLTNTAFPQDSGQTDLYKSTNVRSQSTGVTWTRGIGFAGNNQSASGGPFGTDRQWNDSYIPPGGTTDNAQVFLTYHDLGPYDGMWMVASSDGGKTFGPPTPIATSAPSAEASFCNTVPGGLKVVQSGPHAGRVYVAWLAADLATNPATGCNYTQMDTFHTVWVAYTDNPTAQIPTWTDQLVYDGGIGHDGSTLFADLALDNQGNPYVTTSMNVGPSPLEADEFDTYVFASFDGGHTWNGKSDGTGAPYLVNAPNSGTHFFATIAAGDPGHVDVAFLGTPTQVPVLPSGKPQAGGDPNAMWKLYFAQSLDLNLGTPTWSVTEVTPNPMHQGDICTLGIFCIPVVSDRSLLDFIDVAIDANGMGHVAYTENNNQNQTNSTWVANQGTGPSAGTGGR
jgi:hypothetical protein